MNEKLFRFLKKFVITITAVALIFSQESYVVKATTVSTSNNFSPMVMIDQYSVTNEKIVPGQEFTLKLKLKNCSSNKTAENIVLNIENPDGVAPAYGTTSQMRVNSIGAGKTRDVDIQYESWTGIETNTLDFKITIWSNFPSNYVVLRIPVGSASPFDIVTQSIPNEVYVSEDATATISFNTASDSKVKDVSVILKEGETEVAKSNIGNVTAGSLENQAILFKLNDIGDHTIEMLLQYTDEKEKQQQINVGNWKVKVTETKKILENETMKSSGDSERMYALILGIGGLFILFMGLLITVTVKKRKG